MTTAIQGLYAIVDQAAMARDCLEGGARIIQLRDKRRMESPETRKRFRENAARIAALKKDFRFLFIVNDDLETALEIGADGVHVGKDDLPIEECRKKINTVGYSAHSLEEAVEAERRGADYVAFGAIYSSPTKGHDHPIQGVEKLREVISRLTVQVVAIGGIDRSNVHEVLKTGAASVAMISALAQAPDRVEEARFFSRLFV